MRNLGNFGSSPTPYDKRGYDGADNNANGLVDEFGEGGSSANAIQALSNHRHKTARSEMLYALLVGSSGPFGSVFAPDDFTEREVKDTDGDGLPEFVDAWGEPLYFYRWPIFFHSDVQKGVDPNAVAAGSGPYSTGGVIETRELEPLDPNQYLMSVVWWSSAPFPLGNGGCPLFGSNGSISGPADFFQRNFHQITEPLPVPSPNPGTFWDRGSNAIYNQRRAYFSRFLIISSGQDKQLGIPILTDTALQSQIGLGPDTASRAVGLEGQAGQFDLGGRITYNGSGTPLNVGVSADGSTPLLQAFQDDIYNHGTQTTGGSTQ